MADKKLSLLEEVLAELYGKAKTNLELLVAAKEEIQALKNKISYLESILAKERILHEQKEKELYEEYKKNIDKEKRDIIQRFSIMRNEDKEEYNKNIEKLRKNHNEFVEQLQLKCDVEFNKVVEVYVNKAIKNFEERFFERLDFVTTDKDQDKEVSKDENTQLINKNSDDFVENTTIKEPKSMDVG